MCSGMYEGGSSVSIIEMFFESTEDWNLLRILFYHLETYLGMTWKILRLLTNYFDSVGY
jgi:hypothetical protein